MSLQIAILKVVAADRLRFDDRCVIPHSCGLGSNDSCSASQNDWRAGSRNPLNVEPGTQVAGEKFRGNTTMVAVCSTKSLSDFAVR